MLASALSFHPGRQCLCSSGTAVSVQRPPCVSLPLRPVAPTSRASTSGAWESSDHGKHNANKQNVFARMVAIVETNVEVVIKVLLCCIWMPPAINVVWTFASKVLAALSAAGIRLENPTWVVVGTVMVSVIAAKAFFVTIITDMQEIKQDIKELRQDVNNVKEDIKQLKSDMKELRLDVKQSLQRLDDIPFLILQSVALSQGSMRLKPDLLSKRRTAAKRRRNGDQQGTQNQ